MRDASVRVVECRVVGEMVVFDKERVFQTGAPRQHVYPTVRTTAPAVTRPGQVIIIPKRLMDKKVKDVGGEKPLKVRPCMTQGG